MGWLSGQDILPRGICKLDSGVFTFYVDWFLKGNVDILKFLRYLEVESPPLTVVVDDKEQ